MEQIFDRDLFVQRKLRALRMAVPGADFLLSHAVDDLSLRLSAVERRFASAAALHGHSPAVAESLLTLGKVGQVLQVECDPAFLDIRPSTGSRQAVSPLEELPLADQSIDLAVSLLSLHETNDTPGLLAQIRRALKPDGLFLAALPGQGTLSELRTALLAAETEITGGASPRVAPLMDVRDAGALLQRAGFALPVVDSESLTVRYDTMFDLMRDLRAMGATNTLIARSRAPSNRRMFMRAAEIYAERFSDPDGRVRATFSLVWLSGWAPHSSQQKPLKPGSAQVSLADFLGERTRN
jgi:SAM-dependent methyltransferase